MGADGTGVRKLTFNSDFNGEAVEFGSSPGEQVELTSYRWVGAEELLFTT